MAQESTPPPKRPTNDPLLQSIRQIVSATNSTLASFEESTHNTTNSLVSRFHALSRQARYTASRAMAAYDLRGYYGPQICAGTALLVGGAVGLSRGKFMGAAAGGVGALVAYENIYGIDLNGLGGERWQDKLQK